MHHDELHFAQIRQSSLKIFKVLQRPLRFSKDIYSSLIFSKVISSSCLKFCEIVVGSLKLFSCSMARKVLSWSLRFCITPKSSLKFAEIRYVSLGSLRFTKVRQSSPRFSKSLQVSLRVSRVLQGFTRY